MSTSPRSLIFSRPAVLATLLVAVALLIGSIALSTISTHEIATADRRASRAQQTLVTVNQLLATMNEAETAQRGFILTRDEKYLAPYLAALPRYRHELTVLRQQFGGSPGRSALVAQLGVLCDRRFAEIAHTIALRRQHGIAPALNVVESDEGWHLMDEIRQRLQLLQKQQVAEITAHTAAANRETQIFQDINRVLLALAIVFGGAAAWVIARRLYHLEGLIKVCAWTQRVQWEGQWISFEEYLAKRFNLHCTHGISEEAARELGREIENTPVPPDA